MNDKLSLSKLQMMIRDSIVLAMPGKYWIAAEISEMKLNYSGHCYLELIEKDLYGDNIRAKARAIIWAAKFRALKPFFESSTGESLSEGIKVLVKVTVEYHELYGLSLIISDIDPTYSLGELALIRKNIVDRLSREGVLNMNAELQLSPIPRRIAVISSAAAAGYADFSRELQQNTYGYIFSTRLFNSPMQGEETSAGVISALNSIAGEIDNYDLVVILRGGGSTSDLRWFDNYDIAFHITQFPIPVITGIGHDKDISVADMVAWKSLKTPTAAASFLVEMMNETDLLLDSLKTELTRKTVRLLKDGTSITTAVTKRLLPLATGMARRARIRINNMTSSLSSRATGRIRKTDVLLSVTKKEIQSTSQRTLTRQSVIIREKTISLKTSVRAVMQISKERMKITEGHLRLADPDNILRKGFTITTLKGKAVKSASVPKQGEVLTTHFYDGTIESKIEK